jgi:hypothetical protein
MRALVMAAAALALLAAPAEAQMAGGKRGHQGDTTKSSVKNSQVIDLESGNGGLG